MILLGASTVLIKIISTSNPDKKNTTPIRIVLLFVIVLWLNRFGLNIQWISVAINWQRWGPSFQANKILGSKASMEQNVTLFNRMSRRSRIC
jgi:hypothetical protein